MGVLTTSLARAHVRSRPGLFRWSPADGLLAGLSVLHGGLLMAFPSGPAVALGLWWGSNTVAHNAIHRPLFRSRMLNRLFALYLTALLGVPQTLWRDLHLAHHAERRFRFRLNGGLAVEIALVLALWGALLLLFPRFFLGAYLPGYLAGMGLCWLHGRLEHLGGGPVSHYGRIYNLLFFNDGYHVEHHAAPGLHWTLLPGRREPGTRTSALPAPLRWLEAGETLLTWLERLVLRSRPLQRFVLRTHERALRKLLAGLPPPKTVGIVGGGLFPRTALTLARLLPGTRLRLIDQSARNLEVARRLLSPLPADLEFITARFDPAIHRGLDLVVIPLSYRGDREALYRCPPARTVIIHDWIWRPRGRTAVVSFWLLKRMNLVCR